MATPNGAAEPLAVTTGDIQAMLDANPMAMMQVQMQALKRTVAEKDEVIAQLQAELKKLEKKAK